MGSYDSSLTRVKPVFEALHEQDPSGESWLPALLKAVQFPERVPAPLRASPGRIVEFQLERPIAPPDAFLEWLLTHPKQLSWPKVPGGRRGFGADTQTFREELIDGAGTAVGQRAQEQGLAALARHGAEGSRHAAWAFEGFTQVDAFIATDRLVLLIEGKRTEVLSPSTDWYPKRNQLARNLEAAGAVAGDTRRGYVLLALEAAIPDPDPELLPASLPHLSAPVQEAAFDRFLGQATWQSICAATGLDYAALPDTVVQ